MQRAKGRTAEWLILAPSADAFSASHPLQQRAVVRVVTEIEAFRAALTRERPRLAMLCVPPAGQAELELVGEERQRRSTLRAVLLNEHHDIDTRLAALRIGFDACLEAEMDAHELAERLLLLARDLGDRRQGQRITIADGLVLDVDAHQLLREGRPIHLRPREFALLEFLARHPRRTFSRGHLLALVWDTAREIDPRTVDVHVRWLREKVELDPGHPAHLTTVRGVGYRLVPGER